MKTTWYLALAAALALPFAGMAQAPYVQPTNGDKVVGSSLSSDGTGNLTLKLKGGASRNFRRGTYRSAWMPKPKEVVAAEATIRKGDMSGALQQLEQAYRKYRYVGWGGYTAYMQAKIFLKTGKNSDAERVCRDALRLPLSESESAKLKQGMVQSLLAQNKVTEAKREIKNLRTTKEGKPKEAVLQYLKTILLFDKSVGSVRKEAYVETVKILEELKDNRAKQFKARYQAEY
jgi:hypothetical protein